MISNKKPIDRITQLIQSGLGRNLQKLPYYRQVMIDPRSGFYNTIYREYAVEIFNNMLDYVLNDAILYTRLRLLLLQDMRRLKPRAFESLLNKSEESGIDIEDLFEVYTEGTERDGYPHLTEEQKGFNAVNSFIANKKKSTTQTIKKVIRGK